MRGKAWGNRLSTGHHVSGRFLELKSPQEEILKIRVYLVVLLMLGSVSSQCTRDASSILGQVTANGLKSLNSLHDYVWIVHEQQIIRDGKGEIKRHDQRWQTVVANGQMYSRTLQPGELPSIPEPEALLSSDYYVAPALYGNCGGLPCGSYPYAFVLVTDMERRWDVRQVREGELNGVPALVIDLREKDFPHTAHRNGTGTGWVDPGRCRLLRLITVSAKPSRHNRIEEAVEFAEVKGNWLPVKREFHGVAKEKISESTEEYTYLKFGASVRILP